NVNAGPNADAGNDITVCEGGQFTLSTPSVGAGGSYSWAGPNGFNANTRQVTVNSANTGHNGNYTVTVTLNGCSSTDNVNVNVNAGPNADAGNDITVCQGGQFTLSTPSVGAGASYAWDGPNGFNANTRQVTVNPANNGHNGNYTVTVTL